MGGQGGEEPSVFNINVTDCDLAVSYRLSQESAGFYSSQTAVDFTDKVSFCGWCVHFIHLLLFFFKTAGGIKPCGPAAC